MPSFIFLIPEYQQSRENNETQTETPGSAIMGLRISQKLFLDQLNPRNSSGVGFQRGPQTIIQCCQEIIQQSPLLYSAEARTSTRSTKSPVVLHFLLTSLLQNPYADTNNFDTVKAKKCKTWATLNSFGRFFFVLASVRWSSFQIWRSECA